MNFCGLKISCLSFDRIIGVLEESHSTSILVTVNAEAIVRSQTDERLRNIINDNLASIDGQIPIWMFRTIHGHPPINKISGSDLIYSIPEYAESKGLKVFLLGGNEKSNYGAVQNLKDKCPNLLIKGYSPEYHPYPFPQRISNEVEKRLKEFRPDIIFAGFGMGKQEYWADDNRNLLNEIGTRLVIGCGGSFDFASGKIRRAPGQFKKSEWKDSGGWPMSSNGFGSRGFCSVREFSITITGIIYRTVSWSEADIHHIQNRHVSRNIAAVQVYSGCISKCNLQFFSVPS